MLLLHGLCLNKKKLGFLDLIIFQRYKFHVYIFVGYHQNIGHRVLFNSTKYQNFIIALSECFTSNGAI